jgi:hypothetical protein
MDELVVHPLQVQWLKACVMFYRAARASQHSSPLFHRTMSANMFLSRHSDIAWCAKLVKFLAVTDVEDGNGSGMDTRIWGIHQALLVVRCMINWAMNIRQAELHNATMQAAYLQGVRTTPIGKVANVHCYLTAGWRALQLPTKVVLSMAK